jgi:hypothetical protein
MEQVRPHICISISDENPGAASKQLKVLSQHEDVWNEFPFRPRTCHLILKQYFSPPNLKYKKSKEEEFVRIPLGYKSGMFDATTGESNREERNLKWSFFGNLHQGNEDYANAANDRQEMISVFKSWQPFETRSNTDVKQVGKFYSTSKFVPIGRGFFNLECFRIYEAIFNGAIPIVVASENEIQKTFSSGGMSFPEGFVFASNWKSALEKAQKLEKDKKKLNEFQRKSQKWLKDWISTIQDKIEKEVKEFVDVVKCW